MNAFLRQKVPASLFSAGLPLVCALLGTLGCAGQVPPGGGPPDTVPPEILRTVPDTNATRVAENELELEFSEYVDRRSVEESIFISPYPGELEFDWSGKEVSVKFGERLKENTTYVVNVGTDVVDLRAQNRMARGFTLAFSTGDSIDQGMISGKVFDEKPEGIMIFAYVLGKYDLDTLDPSKTKPEYIMQTGKDGVFTLSNIALGRYRLIAVRDEYRNLVYEKQVDQFGVTTGDTTLTPALPRLTGLAFQMAREDTARPFLASVQIVHSRHLRLRFSEPVDSLSQEGVSVSIKDTVSGAAVGVMLWSAGSVAPEVLDVITAARLDSGAVYRIRVGGFVDKSSNFLDTANASAVITGDGNPDTVRPMVSVSGIQDSARGIPLDRSLIVEFTEPVLQGPLRGAIRLLDSVRVEMPATLQWVNASHVQVIPRKPLKPRAWYSATVIMDSVRDYWGNRWKDSVWAIRFQTIDLRTTGTIEGAFLDERKEGARGLVYVTAQSVDRTLQQPRTVRLEGTAPFAFQHLPEGMYVLRAYRDQDSSGTYSFGRPFPYVPSERFVVLQDTIRVRARWGVEGVVLRLR